MTKIKDWISSNPLGFILILGLAIRLVAVFFAKGYMMFDDHYLIVEPAGGWAKGVDVNKWLPGTEGNSGPHFMSFFYVGLVWIFFEVLNFFGIEEATTQMFFLRLVHAVYSLLTVYFAYKITLRLSNRRDAFLVGMLMALLAYFPNFSVKQLVEMVCIPPLLASYYFILKSEWKDIKAIILAGIMAGIAVGIRYQTGLIYLGIGVVFILQNLNFSIRKYRGLIVLSLIAGAVFFLTQISDLILWKEPFAQLKAYIGHNTHNSGNYVNSPWYNYALTLIAFLIPPISLMILFGFFREWKRHLLFVFPAVLFLVFHSLYPNKQERFILPILPLIVIIGVIGWNKFREASRYWNNHPKLHKGVWTFFWIINTLVLLAFSTAYTKKQYVESMVWLSRQDDISRFIVENSNVEGFTMVPKYYYNSWDFQFELNKQHTAKYLQPRIIEEGEHPYPNYVMFYGDENLELRIQTIEEAFGGMEEATIIEPGNLDKVLHYLNPHNKIERIYIYRIVDFPEGVTDPSAS